MKCCKYISLDFQKFGCLFKENMKGVCIAVPKKTSVSRQSKFNMVDFNLDGDRETTMSDFHDLEEYVRGQSLSSALTRVRDLEERERTHTHRPTRVSLGDFLLPLDQEKRGRGRGRRGKPLSTNSESEWEMVPDKSRELSTDKRFRWSF